MRLRSPVGLLVFGSAVTSAAVVVTLALPVGASGRPGPQSAPGASGSAADRERAVSKHVGAGPRAARPWTAERMRNAEPRDLPVDGTGAAPAASAASPTAPFALPRITGSPTGGTLARPQAPSRVDERGRPPVPKTAGKLFFTGSDGFDYVCSASTINTKTKNLIITAGHCVHDGFNGDFGWSYNIAFVPKYHKGRAPYGIWHWKKATSFNGWIYAGDSNYDMATVSLQRRNGARIVEKIGGNGVTWGYPRKMKQVRIWGWPVENPSGEPNDYPSVDGEVAKTCHGTTFATDDFGAADAGLDCKLTGGSSGGPWVIGQLNRDVGFVFAVTSRRTILRVPAALLARPLPKAIKNLL